MATDRDVQNARENGRRAGYNQAVTELRRFTGVAYLSRYGDRRRLVPDLTEPEHIAYQWYASELAQILAELEQQCETLDQTISDTIDDSVEANAALRKRLEERRDARSQSLPLTRATGRIGDLFVKERAQAREVEQLLDKRHELSGELNQDRYAVGGELNEVTAWLQAAKESLESI